MAEEKRVVEKKEVEVRLARSLKAEFVVLGILVLILIVVIGYSWLFVSPVDEEEEIITDTDITNDQILE
ncbi:hypothetical protein GF376_01390 [Candidatus Peregrinibacteria bacterium]|nr:hypothetical protein [Candidatus Peregrinibacteria bacterium]